MEDKLILVKGESGQAVKPAFVEAETHAKLKDLSTETGISMVKLISKCVEFAIKHIEIVDSDAVAGR